MGQGDPSEDFANDAQERDAAIVVVITTVTLVLVRGDYVGLSHVLGDVTLLLPAQAEELMEPSLTTHSPGITAVRKG